MTHEREVDTLFRESRAACLVVESRLYVVCRYDEAIELGNGFNGVSKQTSYFRRHGRWMATMEIGGGARLASRIGCGVCVGVRIGSIDHECDAGRQGGRVPQSGGRRGRGGREEASWCLLNDEIAHMGIPPEFSNKRPRQSCTTLVTSTKQPSIRRHVRVPNVYNVVM